MTSGVPIGLALLATIIAVALFRRWLQLRRAEFIRTYLWPPGLLERLEKHRGGLERKDSALVSRGLRQFFVAYLMSGNRYVSMPGIADLTASFTANAARRTPLASATGRS